MPSSAPVESKVSFLGVRPNFGTPDGTEDDVTGPPHLAILLIIWSSILKKWCRLNPRFSTHPSREARSCRLAAPTQLRADADGLRPSETVHPHEAESGRPAGGGRTRLPDRSYARRGSTS